MGTKKGSARKKKGKAAHPDHDAGNGENLSAGNIDRKKLELVLKCDTSGCTEAVTNSLASLNRPEVGIHIVSSGVGSITKSDIFMAETGSRLIIGFNVGIMPYIDRLAADHNVDIRLYDVIYRLIDDIESIISSFVPSAPEERITGTAKVIALFKSSRKGIIAGCEVLQGKLTVGSRFRVLGAMGILYTGTIESLHIEKNIVREAREGQQVGLKIRDFNKVRIGDLVESFVPGKGQGGKPWQPTGNILYP